MLKTIKALKCANKGVKEEFLLFLTFLSPTTVYVYIYMKSLFSSFISENFLVPQREANPCLPIAGTVVLPLDYTVSEGVYIYPSLQTSTLSKMKFTHTYIYIDR